MNVYTIQEDRVSVIGLIVEFVKCSPLLVMFGALYYFVNSIAILQSIKTDGVISDRNFFNKLAIHMAEEEGLDFKVLSESPGHHYATDENGRMLP